MCIYIYVYERANISDWANATSIIMRHHCYLKHILMKLSGPTIKPNIYICVYKVSALVCAPAYIHTNTICEYWAHICMIWSSQLQFGTSKKRWRWWWWWCFAAFICVSNCIISKTNSAYWNMRIYLCIRSRKICSILFYTFFCICTSKLTLFLYAWYINREVVRR